MTPADLARRLFRDQCNIGSNSTLEAYGETAAVAAMVPLIEAFQECVDALGALTHIIGGNGHCEDVLAAARAALTPQPEEVA